ncbi:MAG: LytR family transcriptional regulator, partial [Solirubrobacteraceae bacterium]|nr:LytR family transcriptional regulator [Solirubrobacteraceae bacterium]
LDTPSETMKMRGRSFELFYDGTRLRLVALRTSKGVYWVSNTLSLTLTNPQMLAIARSLTPLGS